jgi:hypothetical protein
VHYRRLEEGMKAVEETEMLITHVTQLKGIVSRDEMPFLEGQISTF